MYDIEKTLFVSDLDGTLLRSDGTLCENTAKAINEMVSRGLKFSFATARSYYTAMRAAGGIVADIPLILHNGVFIRDSVTGERLHCSLLDNLPFIKKVFDDCGLSPMVYSLDGLTERYTYVPELLSPEQAMMQAGRKNDPRDNPISDADRIWDGEAYYVLCIAKEERLRPAYEALRDDYNCIYGKDYYSGELWLEIVHKQASKASAVQKLREILGCEKVVVFGDAHNDVPMFEIADEAYAVAGAADELKARATAVIGSNDDDAVVRWLRENVGI